MRRADRLREDASFINQTLDEAEEIFLALLDRDYPYCIPLNFARKDDKLYIHCAYEGHKIDLLMTNPHVAFACALDIEIDRAASTTYYRSVSGTGLASIVEDLGEKCLALELIGEKYAARCPRPCPPQTAGRVQIIKIAIVSATGKQNSRP